MVARVLVPYDGTDCAARGVERALERFGDAKVTLLRVVDPLSSRGLDRSKAPIEPDVEGSDEGSAGEVVDPPVPDDREADVRTVVEPGEPAQTIVEYAETNDPDAIVMGTRDPSWLSRLVFGTVSETVADNAPAPVHVVS